MALTMTRPADDLYRGPTLEEILGLAPVIPVIVIEKLEDAVPLAEALVEGGLPVLEVTLRSDAAIEAIEAIAQSVPGAVVGAGTVVEPSQVFRVRDAGARFIVSPGAYPALTEAVLASGIPFLPGAATPSEVMDLLARGFRYQKLFPAEVVGGMGMLKALAAPIAAVKFCPTGGVTPESAPDYLALPNVVCVGGSWIAPPKLVAAKDWAAITGLARQAASLRR
ncbi:bifunctional 4-hydroxy-2-oxoglutarate aldolase/2-dehydro-3-deoxy-phosphogluconate aldolase [Indioceanicola profundi]|uniref:bifunctional 4-hydroxy-2-oxoglutarate aldolase/2-dehydro-3-deoxy-phosphogluconate aldolase n=1 Tax=Indioceanicola profundi TaxID=2220096 RepID=UPI001CED6B5D|nr:bifunctional 4-hydroxy-2-oxoglutarate aldolase/2-dehydro-3-deoxy-phosphogluconate aldolase [Indioceanicola profundi]